MSRETFPQIRLRRTAIVVLRLPPPLLSTIIQRPHGAMPPPRLQTNLSLEQPLNNASQPPQVDATQRQPTPPPPTYSPVTPELRASFLAAPPNTATSSIGSPYPFTAPAAASSPDPSSSTTNHAHPQPRLHLKGPAPLVATPPQQSPPPPPPPPPPAPVPISLEHNPDVIALRAAMSVLQMQRQQALKDMVTLEKQKSRALQDVEGFTDALGAGRIKMRNTSGILLPPGVSPPLPGDEAADDAEEGGADGGAQTQGTLQPGRESVLGGGGDGAGAGAGAFEQPMMEIPSAQNVVRMPPINWSKYHIVGESLDRLHAEQKVRPSATTTTTTTTAAAAVGVPSGTRKEAEVAAPYDPFVDKLDATSTKAGSGSVGAGTGSAAGGSAGSALIEGVNTRRKSGGGGGGKKG